MENINRSLLLERLKSGYSLPSLSPVALKLVEMASDEKSSAEDLVDLIEKDPSLAVRLLKLANSAFFSSIHSCTTLNQAVVKIGYNRLRIMALSISLRETFPMGKKGPLDYNKFWRISLYRALIARAIAEQIRIVNPDEAFVAGLVREIGLLVFFDLFIRNDKNQAMSLEIEPIEELLAREKERYGMDHREVGEAVLEYWNFPNNMVKCLVGRLVEVNGGGLMNLDSVCKFAELFSSVLFNDSGLFLSIYEEAEKHLGMNRNLINDILLDTFKKVEETAGSLMVEVDRERDLMAVMEKANIALSHLSEKISEGDVAFEQTDKCPSFDTIDNDDQMVSKTLQAVAHEIRNPLLAVGGFARKLSGSFEADSKGGQYLKILLEEAERLEKVLSEMTRERSL